MTNEPRSEASVPVPRSLDSLTSFRDWSASDEFPSEGRIDFVSGCIEVDLSPEDLYTHGTVKTEFVVVLGQRAKRIVPDDLFTDSTRISSIQGDVSAEPDLVFVSESSLRRGTVRRVPKSTREPERYVELCGAPDVIVEIVSDTSVGKDTRRLPLAYLSAGVREY